MNSLTANQTNASDYQRSIFDTFLIETTAYLSEYVIPIISAIGVLCNLFGVTILSNRKLKNKFYDFLWCRCFCNLVICFFGVFFKNLKIPNDYRSLFLQWYFLILPSRILFFTSSISDLLLILNRLFFLFHKTNSSLMKLPKWVSFIYYS